MFIKILKAAGRWLCKFIKGALVVGTITGVINTSLYGSSNTKGKITTAAGKVGDTLGAVASKVLPQRRGAFDKTVRKVLHYGGTGIAAYITIVTLLCAIKCVFLPISLLTNGVKRGIMSLDIGDKRENHFDSDPHYLSPTG